MCQQINAEFVLGQCFLYCSEPLNFGKLREIRDAIEHAVDEFVYVDVSTPSLASAIELYPNMFRWVGDDIARAEKPDFNEEYIQKRFGHGIKEELRVKVCGAISASFAHREQ